MEHQTLLSTLWNMPSDTAAQDARNVTTVRERLIDRDLIPAGNFRNKPAEYWVEDEEND